MIALQNITKRYKDIVALNNVSAYINSGDFVMIKGYSGSGKSTLLKIIGGLLNSDKGKLIYDNEDITRLSEKELSLWRRKNVGFIFQQFQLLDYLSAIDNVMVPMMYRKIELKNAWQRARKLLDLVGLKKYYQHTPNQLSGGQAQRVAIARSLANYPRLLLCDEPTGALDYTNSIMVMDLLKLVNKHGITVVIVTHQRGLESYANRLWQMNEGSISFND